MSTCFSVCQRLEAQVFLRLAPAVLYGLSAPLWLLAQTTLQQTTVDNLNYGDFDPKASFVYYGKESSLKGAVAGDIYWDSTWQVGKAWFYAEIVRFYTPDAPDSVAGYPIRVDALNHLVEFRLDAARAKAIDASSVRALSWFSAEEQRQVTLVNAREYPLLRDKCSGLVELLAQGVCTVFRCMRIQIIQPTYNVALDVGSRDVRLIKKQVYYALKNGQLQRFSPRAVIRELLKDQEAALQAYQRAQQLNPRQLPHLVRLLAYYNELEAARQ